MTAPGSGAEIIPFLKTWVNLPAAIGFTILYTKARPSSQSGAGCGDACERRLAVPRRSRSAAQLPSWGPGAARVPGAAACSAAVAGLRILNLRAPAVRAELHTPSTTSTTRPPPFFLLRSWPTC